MNNRFVIETVQVAAPGRGRNYYYPAEVRVRDTSYSKWHAVRGLVPGILFRKFVCGTRYSGPKSQYGKALTEALVLVEKLKSENNI